MASTLDVPKLSTTFMRRLGYREASFGFHSLPRAEELRTPEDREAQYRTLRYLIGNTPLLFTKKVGTSSIITKYESQNPSESHYDRAYVDLLERLEGDGVIQPGDTLLEITSGSAGISAAWLADRLGYNARIIVPEELPPGRVQEMVNLNATVEVAESGDTAEQSYVGAAAKHLPAEMKRYREEGYEVRKHQTEDYFVVTAERNGDRICLLNHSEHQLTVDAFRVIGREVLDVVGARNVDVFVSALGNFTTTVGITEGLREGNPTVEVIGFETEDRPVHFNERYGIDALIAANGGIMFGTSTPGVHTRFMRPEMLSDIMLVDVAKTVANRIAFNIGKPTTETVGDTTIAAWDVAERIATERPGSIVLTVAYDKGDRYGEPVMANDWTAIAATDPIRERARMKRAGFHQGFAGVADQLPASLQDERAGGLGRVFEGWALA